MNQRIKKFLKSVYSVIPFKQKIFLIGRAIGIGNTSFYKKLKFKGTFSVNIDGSKVKLLNTGGSIENELFWKGIKNTVESDTLWIWIILSRHSKVILDIGANTGIYALISKSLNPSSAVFAFEPSEKTFQVLKKNCALNGYDIIAEQIALSNTNGKVPFYDLYEDNQTSASLSADKLKNASWYKGRINEYEVESITLQNYIARKKIHAIDLMKIDVELHEPEVLEGCGDFLNQFQPILIVEILTPEVAERIGKLLPPSQYCMYHLYEPNVLHLVQKIEPQPNRWNYLFVPRNRLHEVETLLSRNRLSINV